MHEKGYYSYINIVQERYSSFFFLNKKNMLAATPTKNMRPIMMAKDGLKPDCSACSSGMERIDAPEIGSSFVSLGVVVTFGGDALACFRSAVMAKNERPVVCAW